MEDIYNVSLDKVIAELSLETLVAVRPPEEILITVARVNRPGLPLTGFYDYFEKERIEPASVGRNRQTREAHPRHYRG